MQKFTPKDIAEFVSNFSNLPAEVVGELHEKIHTVPGCNKEDSELEPRFWESLPQDEACDYNGRAAERILGRDSIAALLTFENIKTILDHNWSYLFQDGIPHISWNTDCYYVMRAYISNRKGVKLINSVTYDSTWRHHTVEYFSIPDNSEYVIRFETESPHLYDGHSTTRRIIRIIPITEMPEPAEWLVVAFGYDKFGSEARMTDSYKGSLDDCVAWVAKKNLDKNHFKMINLSELDK